MFFWNIPEGDSNENQLLFDFSVPSLHINSWYGFVIKYTFTLSVHIHYFCDYRYIFHLHIQGTGFTCSTFLHRHLHTQNQKLSSTSYTCVNMVLVFMMVLFYTNILHMWNPIVGISSVNCGCSFWWPLSELLVLVCMRYP